MLVAEIGSTTTVVNAFELGEHAGFLGQGMAPTTVDSGDVTVGLEMAVDDFRKKSGDNDVGDPLMLAASSAAGGLSMSVHGLVYDMTVRAARGRRRRQVRDAGDMTQYDLQGLRVQPKIILLAGGVDYRERYGEKRAVLFRRASARGVCETYGKSGIADIFRGQG